MLKGCDLSVWQSATPAGYDFYIIKASEGVGFKDARLDQHYNAVAEMGKLYGFYHYARPDLGNEPEAEADWFLSLVGQHAGDCLFCLDWEGNSLNYSADWALRWCERVYQKTSVKPTFYCSEYPISTGKYRSIADYNVSLWMAQYADEPALPESSGWRNLTLWQYTDNDNGVDGDYFYGDTDTWKRICAGTRSETTPAPKPITDALLLAVLKGEYGNGQDRINRLNSAGYDASKVQDKVNWLVTVANNVIAGKFGNGQARIDTLTHWGYNADTVQKAVNILLGM